MYSCLQFIKRDFLVFFFLRSRQHLYRILPKLARFNVYKNWHVSSLRAAVYSRQLYRIFRWTERKSHTAGAFYFRRKTSVLLKGDCVFWLSGQILPAVLYRKRDGCKSVVCTRICSTSENMMGPLKKSKYYRCSTTEIMFKNVYVTEHEDLSKRPESPIYNTSIPFIMHCSTYENKTCTSVAYLREGDVVVDNISPPPGPFFIINFRFLKTLEPLPYS